QGACGAPSLSFLVSLLSLCASTALASGPPAHGMTAPDLPKVRPSWVALSDFRFLGELAALSVSTPNIAHTWAWDEFPESNGRFARDLARNAGRLATPAYFVPPLAGAWLAGKLTDHPGLSRSALRLTASVGVASAVSGVIKYSVGRPRPFQSPDDGDDI